MRHCDRKASGREVTGHEGEEALESTHETRYYEEVRRKEESREPDGRGEKDKIKVWMG